MLSKNQNESYVYITLLLTHYGWFWTFLSHYYSYNVKNSGNELLYYPNHQVSKCFAKIVKIDEYFLWFYLIKRSFSVYFLVCTTHTPWGVYVSVRLYNTFVCRNNYVLITIIIVTKFTVERLHEMYQCAYLYN